MDEKPNPVETGASQAASVYVPSVAGGAGGRQDQRQQTIKAGDQNGDKINAYGARLSRRIMANLVYPEEVRKHGIEGVSRIMFTVMESGDIKTGSLRVQRSSGYPGLDESALKSALASSPFEERPKEMTISIAVSFDVMMARAKRASAR